MEPSEMTDEQLDAAINGTEVAPEAPKPSKPDEPKPSEAAPVEPVEPSKPAEPEPEGQKAAEEPKPSEAIPEISARMEKRAEKLAIANIIQRKVQEKQEQKPGGLDYAKELETNPETVTMLEADRERYAQAKTDPIMEQVKAIRWTTRLEIDAPKMEAKYPQLDKNSEQFDEHVADALNQHYLNLVGYDSQNQTVANSDLRYSDFVEAQFELASALASDKVAASSKNIAKQAASTGLRPDGSSAKTMNLNKAPENMTDEELDAVIAQTLSRR